jgi:hypothetical protein
MNAFGMQPWLFWALLSAAFAALTAIGRSERSLANMSARYPCLETKMHAYFITAEGGH